MAGAFPPPLPRALRRTLAGGEELRTPSEVAEAFPPPLPRALRRTLAGVVVDFPQAALLSHRQNFLVQLIPAVFLLLIFRPYPQLHLVLRALEASFWLLRGLWFASPP